jgi:hypothetical protein
MTDLRTASGARLTREQQWRLVRAVAASAVTGVAIYLLVMHIGLPALAAQLTEAQMAKLRQTFVEHPAMVLGAVVGIAAVLGLPVLGVFRWVYGPLNVPVSRKRGT